MSSLIALDQYLLLLLNGWRAAWADVLMWQVSKAATWLPLYALMVGALIVRYRKPRCIFPQAEAHWWQQIPACIWLLIGFAVAVGGSDYITSGIIKPWICRPRPTHEPALEGLVHTVKGYTGGLYGFCSSHAANTMACATLFSLIWRKNWVTTGLMLWVTLNCYSRMYLGVHYPGDIIAGLAIGSLMGGGVYLLLRHLGLTEACGSKAAGDDAVRAQGET